MSWNYRVVHRRYEHSKEENYAIHETYYDEFGAVEMISAEPDYPAGENTDELRTATEHYLEALEKPVLEYSDIVVEEKQNG